jgi:hypothetical protein
LGKRVSGKGDGPGWLPFDLLGDPVPANKGCRGRPQHAKDTEIFESLIRHFGMGWSVARVAQAHGMATQTMNRHYFSTHAERKARQHAMDIFEAELLGRLDRQSKAGKTAATVQLLKRMDKARLGVLPDTPPKGKPKPKGIKEERRERAWTAGMEDQDWSDLIGPTARPN